MKLYIFVTNALTDFEHTQHSICLLFKYSEHFCMIPCNLLLPACRIQLHDSALSGIRHFRFESCIAP
jgi:hypothetical protein